ncbi:MAG: GNAT family N-acetyltransferase [Clostridiales bacterium]|nr:GNAT family N-acetyltransferase [Clostridiales bacterium]
MFEFKTVILNLSVIHLEMNGLSEMLENLKNDGCTLCVLSDQSNESTHKILHDLHIDHYFKVVKSTFDGLKEHQLIKQSLDETSSSSAIVVGVSASSIDAAELTRCISLGVNYGDTVDENQLWDFTATNLSEVTSIVRKINGVLRDIVEQILIKKTKDKPIIVGINGVDASGKSTLTKELSRYLDKIGFRSQLISIDDFHNPTAIRYKEENPIQSYLNNAFDVNKFESEVLLPIVLGGELNKVMRHLDLATDEFTNIKKYYVDKDTVVLVEGVLLFREPLVNYFDLRVFIRISFNEVLKRAIIRDADTLGDQVLEKYKSKYIPIQQLYLDQYDPEGMSDIVIDNNDFLKPEVYLKSHSSSVHPYRVRLSTINEEHINAISIMFLDKKVQEMLGVINHPKLEDYHGSSCISFAIINETNEFIGIVEVFNISWKNRRGELSIVIDPSMRGKGYGYEAINRILEILFLEKGLNRVWLRVLETNEKALNLYKKVGFTQEGICFEESIRNGEFINQVQMSILMKDWIHLRFTEY